jgi:hypothetical protein
MQNVKVPLEVDIPTLNLIMKGLAELPFKESFELIGFLQSMGQTALARAAEAKPPPSDQ